MIKYLFLIALIFFKSKILFAVDPPPVFDCRTITDKEIDDALKGLKEVAKEEEIVLLPRHPRANDNKEIVLPPFHPRSPYSLPPERWPTTPPPSPAEYSALVKAAETGDVETLEKLRATQQRLEAGERERIAAIEAADNDRVAILPPAPSPAEQLKHQKLIEERVALAKKELKDAEEQAAQEAAHNRATMPPSSTAEELQKREAQKIAEPNRPTAPPSPAAQRLQKAEADLKKAEAERTTRPDLNKELQEAEEKLGKQGRPTLHNLPVTQYLVDQELDLAKALNKTIDSATLSDKVAEEALLKKIQDTSATRRAVQATAYTADEKRKADADKADKAELEALNEAQAAFSKGNATLKALAELEKKQKEIFEMQRNIAQKNQDLQSTSDALKTFNAIKATNRKKLFIETQRKTMKEILDKKVAEAKAEERQKERKAMQEMLQRHRR